MTRNDIAKALIALRPDSKWVLHGDTLDGLVWLDENQTRPSDAEIEAEIEAEASKHAG